MKTSYEAEVAALPNVYPTHKTHHEDDDSRKTLTTCVYITCVVG